VVIRPLRVVFFGTPAFAVPTLEALLESRHQVVGVVTQPDRPVGRGHHLTLPPAKARALASGVPVLQPDTLKDQSFVHALGAFDADIGVVAAYGKLLPRTVLAVPRFGLLNVHASVLPRYRGAAPVHRAVIAGDRETGVTIMRVVSALDAGPTLAVAGHPIGDDETSLDVERALALAGARLLVETLDRFVDPGVEERPQDDGAATYAPRLSKDEGWIDWSQSARDVHNRVRGLHPWPHAFSLMNERRVILLRSSVSARSYQADPGTVVVAQGDDLTVATGAGAVNLLELQLEGRRPMGAREFMSGHPPVPGQRFSGPP
jgi:methionyl-tRNA formyltransferase